MTNEQAVGRRSRRTAVEVEQVVKALEDSGLNRSQFCRREGLALATLNQYLKRVRGEARSGLVAVELRDAQVGNGGAGGSGLVIVLPGGLRIEVRPAFDEGTLQRLVQVLETR